MDQGNQFQNQQYGYDHYDQAPKSGYETTPPAQGLSEKIMGPALAQKFKSPLVATFILLLVGVAFAGVIIGSYPDTPEEEAAVPVVQADAGPFKVDPDDPGGMDIPFRESTVFETVRKDPMDPEAPIENLLDPDGNEVAIDKLAAFEEEAAKEIKETAAEASDDVAAKAEQKVASVDSSARIKEVAPKKPTVESKTIKQDIVKVPPQRVASATQTQERPELHTPGASPDTIAFVRSVLDKKDADNTVAARSQASVDAAADRVARIEPAAGAASGAVASVGDYFVQLASVTSESAAGGEWAKLQKKFPGELGHLDYKVQRADLGERGTYYRIRVGPYDKEFASSLCGSIKAQKPGGCLVTK